MNERIKLLALEAFQPINDIASEGIADRHTFNQTWFQHYNQKFAELIIQECLKIVEPDQTSGDEWCVTLDETAQSIRQHFGVEE
jgi:hypothetical protein